jgi:hypothetical protein
MKNSIRESLELSEKEYDTLYAHVERSMQRRGVLCRSLRTKSAKEDIHYITESLLLDKSSVLHRLSDQERMKAVTHVAVRCNHNTARRQRVRFGRSRLDLNPSVERSIAPRPTPNGDGTVLDRPMRSSNERPRNTLSTILLCTQRGEIHTLIRTRTLLRPSLESGDMDVEKWSFALFLQTVEEDIGFDGRREGIFYYIQMRGAWGRMHISTESRWHSALEDVITSGVDRASFTIEPLKE